MPLPTPLELERARDRTIADVLPGPDEPLRVLFCGINPGLVSAATGYHFARPGNRFWRVLHEAGFTQRQLAPHEEGELARAGLGLTNLVASATAVAAELTRDEISDGGARLRALADERRPAWLAVLGVTAYRDAFADRRAQIGRQQVRWGETGIWVLPNPSGLNAGWSTAAMVEEFARLRLACQT